MAYRIALLPGDGIGIEVMAQARAVLDEIARGTDLRFEFDEIPCGGQFYLKHGSRDWPEGAEERTAAADVILLGAVGWPSADGKGPVNMANGQMAGWSPVIGTRMRLELYANVRPVKLWPGVRHRVHGKHVQVWDPSRVDMVIVRENTEGLYSGIGGSLNAGTKRSLAIDTRVITRPASERVIRYAFELSRNRKKGAPKDGKKRVTCIVKNNVLKGCQFFEEVFHEIGADYPEIEKDIAIVDAFTQWLIGQPEYYDVCVTTNMFGDIVTDLASVLQGGMGMAVGCNVGDRHGMFEPIHGSAPKHAGQNKANPMAMILAAGEALRWLGGKRNDGKLTAAGDAIEASVAAIVAAGKPLTYDLVDEDKAAPMSEVGAAIRAEVGRRVKKQAAVA
jgi:isocitrate/isopropylmalate dehydrogenase